MSLDTAHTEYVRLYVSDVNAHPLTYKERVRHDPAGSAASLINGLTEAEVKQLTRDLRSEMRAVARLAPRVASAL